MGSHLDGDPIWMGIRMGFPSGWGSGWESHLDGDLDGNPIWMGIWIGIRCGWDESHVDGVPDGDPIRMESGWGSGLDAGGWIWHDFLTFITVHWSLRLKYR